MAPIGLIINDKSDRSASVIDDILAVAQRHSGIHTAVLDGITGLERALADMNDKGVETLIIGGGDGTLQAAFTDILNNNRFDTLPKFAVLACGMTNVIANDCGFKGPPAQELESFLTRHANGQTKETTRALIRLTIGDQAPIFGFFLGAAAFYSAVQFSRDKVQARGAKRSLALLATVLGYTWKVAMDTSNTVDCVPLKMEGENVPAPARDATQLLFMATTLKVLGSGIYPFWGEGNGSMAMTTVEEPGNKLLRAAPFVIRGKSRPWFQDNGYHSWTGEKLVTHFEGPFVFDGEVFETSADQPTVLDCSDSVTFLQ